MFLKTIGQKTNKHTSSKRLLYWLGVNREKIFKALIESDISHEEFTLVINEK